MDHRKTPQRSLETDERRRTFTDEEGVFWEVREAKAGAYDRRGGNCLIFESNHIVRRVRSFPDEWDKLPERDLAELSRRP